MLGRRKLFSVFMGVCGAEILQNPLKKIIAFFHKFISDCVVYLIINFSLSTILISCCLQDEINCPWKMKKKPSKNFSNDDRKTADHIARSTLELTGSEKTGN